MSVSIHLEVRSGSKALLSLGLETALDLLASGGSGPPPGSMSTPSSPGPRIVAVVGKEEHIVKQYRSRHAAERDLPHVCEELNRLGPKEWAASHGVPLMDNDS
jgi:hypothetical protein